MKRLALIVTALATLAIFATPALAQSRAGHHYRHWQHQRLHEDLQHRAFHRELDHRAAHRYPMTWRQHERLHDHLEHEAFHDRLEHRAHHRMQGPGRHHGRHPGQRHAPRGGGFNTPGFSIWFGR